MEYCLRITNFVKIDTLKAIPYVRACMKVCPVACNFHSIWFKLVFEDIPYGFE